MTAAQGESGRPALVMDTSFGATLRRHRRAAGLSQSALADRIGLDVTYISKIENGRLAPPAADAVIAMAGALGVSPPDLLALTGKIPTAVRRMIGMSKAAQEFLYTAVQLSLTEEEWSLLIKMLHRLRSPEETRPEEPGVAGPLAAP